MTNLNTPFSKSIAIKHLVLLYITTCGLYFFYWFYQTNKQLYGHNHINNKPGWRTLGLIVPLLNIYLLWTLFNDIQKFTQKAGVKALPYPGWLTFAFIICSALYRLPNLFSFFGFSSVLPIIAVQQSLNLYWHKEQAELPEKTKLGPWELVICIVGSILLILAFLGAGLSPSQQ